MKEFKTLSMEEPIEYDETLWEPVKLPLDVAKIWFNDNNEYTDEELAKAETLHYVGPIIDGKITCDVPEIPLYWETFSGLLELKEIPMNFRPMDFWYPFKDCKNLIITEEFRDEYMDRYKYCSGKRYGSILSKSNANVVNMESIHTFQEFISCLVGYDVGLHDKIKTNLFGINIANDIYDVFEALQIILDDGAFLDDRVIINNALGKFVIKRIHKASDIKANILYADSRFVLASHVSGCIRLDSKYDVIVYVFEDDFSNDTMNADILKVRPETLSNCTLKKALDCSNKSELCIDGDVTIISEGDSPAVICNKNFIIKGSGTLKLVGKGMHPALGLETHTGMSYGRWCPDGYNTFNELIIDGVQVTLESDVPNFTLGSYGISKIPKIKCINGGSLECPEMHGNRIMKQSGAEDLAGSTKRSNPAIYEIEDNGLNSMSLF